MEKKVRNSNMELLRIVSMLMVLWVHMDGAALSLPKVLSEGSSAADIWKLTVETLVIIGVNCFTLISGYFGIRLRFVSVLGFLFQCLFYAVGIASLAWIVNPAAFGFQKWLNSWLVLTHTDLWYVPAYFMLMILSPFINKGMEALTRRKNLILVSVFVFFNLWGGWFWQGKFNPTGYTVVQLIMVYMIGRVIALFPELRKIAGFKWIILYLVASVGILWTTTVISVAKAYAYNSPFVLLSSFAFFMAFLSIDNFRAPWVNFLAKSSFAVYLVHKSPFIWVCWFRPVMLFFWKHLTLYGYTCFIISMAIAIYLLLIPIDYLRRKLFSLIIRLFGSRLSFCKKS